MLPVKLQQTLACSEQPPLASPTNPPIFLTPVVVNGRAMNSKTVDYVTGANNENINDSLNGNGAIGFAILGI